MLELRTAIRRVLHHPLIALTLVLLVGLAVGVNTAVFALVSRVLLAELPYSAPAELVRVWTGGREDAAGSMGPLDYRTIADSRVGALASVAAYRRAELQVGGTGAPPVAGLFITPSLFEVLKSWPRCVSPATVDVLRKAGHRIALVRQDYARQNGLEVSCGAAQHLMIDGEPYQVVGTITEAVRLLENEPQVFVVFEPQQIRVMEGSVLSIREAHVSVLGRLAPGVSLDAAARHLSQSGRFQGSRAVRLISMKQEQTQHVAGSILLLQVLAVFVLVVTIINLAQILQAHAYERAADAAVRASLGASFWRSHQSLVMELCLVTAAGAAAALLVHRVTWGLLQRFGPAAPPRPWLDSGDALQVVLAGALAALLCGLAPVLPVLFRMRLTGAALFSSAKGAAARAGLTRGDLRVSQCLLAAQAAVMTAGVVVGALLLWSTSNLLAVDLGFDAAHVVAAPLRITRPVFTERVEALLFLLDSVAQDPKGRYAIASNIPLTTTVTVKVRVPGSDDRDVLAHRIDVTAGYFDILGVALRRGRGFAASDSAAGEPVAIVSEEFGRKFLDDRPLGRTLIVGSGTWRVVGVVENVLSNGVRSLSTPTLYIHLPQARLGVLGNPRLVLQRAELLMTTNEPLSRKEVALREVVRRASPGMSVGGLRALSALVERDTRQTRFLTGIVVVFVGITLVLGALATAAATAQYLALRRTDLAIRIALGASPRRARRLVLSAAALPAMAGVACGLPLAYLISSLVRAHLFGVQSSSAGAYVAAVFVVSFGCLVATLPAAVRGGRVDPAEALRSL